MLKLATTIAFITLCFLQPAIAHDDFTACKHRNPSVTTLRLYFRFPPDMTPAVQKPKGFKPEIAKLFVDDHYIGDAIVNLADYVPTLRFPKSSPKIRVEMSQNRKFETEMTFLGNGSTQVLCIDFSRILYVDLPENQNTTVTTGKRGDAPKNEG